MENSIMLQTLVGVFGVMSITLTVIFAGYWTVFGKKQFMRLNQQNQQKINQDTSNTAIR